LSEIAKRTDERRRQLAIALEPTFGNRTDAEFAASLLVGWLQAECDDLIKQEDRTRYLTALPELPKNAPLPRALYISISDAVDPHWEVTFVLGGAALESSLRFPTKAAAAEYASHILTSWPKMGGR
jgi:hypothetical protein